MRRQRTTLIAAASAALIAVLTVPAAGAAEIEDHPTSVPKVSVGVEQSSEAEIRRFWTEERTQQALANPLDMAVPQRAAASRPGSEKTSGTRSASAEAALPQAPEGLLEAAPPGYAPAAEEISVSQPVPDSTTWPYVIVGKILIEDSRTNLVGSCSGAAIVSDTRNAVWTAGHCVHPGDGSGDAGYFTKIEFIPGYKDGQRPLGTWVAERKYASEAWTNDQNAQAADMAALVLAPHPTYGNLQDRIGGMGYRFGYGPDWPEAVTVGYPGEGYNRTDLTGEQMMYCAGNLEDAGPWNPFEERIKMDCDMGKGSSGGPMVIGVGDGNPQIVGANSHYEALPGTEDRVSDDLFSSEHGDHAITVINAVNDSV